MGTEQPKFSNCHVSTAQSIAHVNLSFADLIVAKGRVACKSSDSVVVSLRAAVPRHGIDDAGRGTEDQRGLQGYFPVNILTFHRRRSCRQEQGPGVLSALLEE